MAGMRELEQMMDKRQTPEELFHVKTIGIQDPKFCCAVAEG